MKQLVLILIIVVLLYCIGFIFIRSVMRIDKSEIPTWCKGALLVKDNWQDKTWRWFYYPLLYADYQITGNDIEVHENDAFWYEFSGSKYFPD